MSTYSTTAYGKITLFCGDSKSGYVHIRTNHSSSWGGIIAKYPIGGSWDDLMEYATRQNLEHPSGGMPVFAGDGKTCYSAPLQIKNDKGVVVKTYYPETIVSTGNKKVITSYPTSAGCR